jgi:hypothetical protein
MKMMMLAGKENKIKQQNQDLDRQIAVIETQLQQLSQLNHDQSQEIEHSRMELVEDIKRQRSLIDQYREVCEGAQSKMHYERTGQKIKNVRMTDESNLLVGIINAEGEESKIRQEIEDISAESRSTGVVGIARNVDVSKFFGFQS